MGTGLPILLLGHGLLVQMGLVVQGQFSFILGQTVLSYIRKMALLPAMDLVSLLHRLEMLIETIKPILFWVRPLPKLMSAFKLVLHLFTQVQTGRC